MTTRLARCLPCLRLKLLFSAQEDMQFADEAFDILGFSSEEKYNVYKVRRRRDKMFCLPD